MSTAIVTHMLLGARVADAAAMGLHWIYDQDHIAKLAPEEPEFRTPNAADYEGVKGYFAHATSTTGREAGMASQYGEQMGVMVAALRDKGGVYDPAAYAAAFHSHFGYGGTYVGYIDHATRDTLDNLRRVADAKAAGGAIPNLRGADDQQFPAIAKLPPLVAAFHTTADDQTMAFDDAVIHAIRFTSDHPNAIAYGLVCAHMMREALKGGDVAAIRDAGLAVANTSVAGALTEALAMKDQSINAITAHFGLACNLADGVPSLLVNLTTAASYQQAVRRNIYAGGDTCGRAILLGALAGAVWGVGGECGIPGTWIDKLQPTHHFTTE